MPTTGRAGRHFTARLEAACSGLKPITAGFAQSLLLSFCIVLAAGSALRAEGSLTGPAVSPRPLIAFTNAESKAFAQSNPECTCRAQGRIYALGSQICLPGANGTQLFRCGMDLNVTSWKSMAKPCPLS